MTFKQVDGGWLFRAPTPKLFGSAPHYILDDAQKQQASDILCLSNPTGVGLRIGLYLGLALVVWVFAVAGVLSAMGIEADKVSGPLAALLYTVILLPIMAIMPVGALVQRRRLEPVLRHARPTDQRMTLADLRSLQRGAAPMTRKQAIGLASMTAATALLMTITIVVRGGFVDAVSYIMLVGVVASLAATVAHIVKACAAARPAG